MGSQFQTARWWSTIKQSIVGLRARVGFIDIVADTATNHLFALKSDGTQVDLEANSTTGSGFVTVTLDGTAGRGAIGKVVLAALPTNAVLDTVTILSPASNLLPNTDGPKIALEVKPLVGAAVSIATGNTNALEVNTDKKVGFDCSVRITVAGDVLQLDISDADITAGTLEIAYTYYLRSQLTPAL